MARGTGGIELTRDLSEITFYDVYEAIGAAENGAPFHFHDSPNPECLAGRNIHALLDDKLKAVQKAMENELRCFRSSIFAAECQSCRQRKTKGKAPEG